MLQMPGSKSKAPIRPVASPAFSASKTSAQTLNFNVITKMSFNNEEFDTNNNYDNVTNFRFQPTVPGKYWVDMGFALVTIAANSIIHAMIYKNGAEFRRDGREVSTIVQPWASVSTMVDMNGTSDYLEAFGYQADSGSANQPMSTIALQSRFSAFRVGP